MITIKSGSYTPYDVILLQTLFNTAHETIIKKCPHNCETCTHRNSCLDISACCVYLDKLVDLKTP